MRDMLYRVTKAGRVTYIQTFLGSAKVVRAKMRAGESFVTLESEPFIEDRGQLLFGSGLPVPPPGSSFGFEVNSFGVGYKSVTAPLWFFVAMTGITAILFKPRPWLRLSVGELLTAITVFAVLLAVAAITMATLSTAT